jgi:hypothetical protein
MDFVTSHFRKMKLFRNVITNQKKLKNYFFEKTQNNDLFISPKRKNTTLEMALKKEDKIFC